MNKNTTFTDNPVLMTQQLDRILVADTRRYLQGDIIMKPESAETDTGIIKSGLAYLLSINNDGEESILDYYGPGSLINIMLTQESIGNLYYILARNETIVTFYSGKKRSEDDENDSELIRNIEQYYFRQKLQHLHMHTDVLSQRSIRKKLMVFFAYLSKENNSSRFTLPMTFTDLANYIAADRSAMTREIRKMNNENIIISDGNNITILKEK